MSTPSEASTAPLDALKTAAAAGKISATAVENIRAWLTEPPLRRIRAASCRANRGRALAAVG